MELANNISIKEQSPGVFIVTCHRCDKVLGVRHTLTESELLRAAHVCTKSN